MLCPSFKMHKFLNVRTSDNVFSVFLLYLTFYKRVHTIAHKNKKSKITHISIVVLVGV